MLKAEFIILKHLFNKIKASIRIAVSTTRKLFRK